MVEERHVPESLVMHHAAQVQMGQPGQGFEQEVKVVSTALDFQVVDGQSGEVGGLDDVAAGVVNRSGAVLFVQGVGVVILKVERKFWVKEK